LISRRTPRLSFFEYSIDAGPVARRPTGCGTGQQGQHEAAPTAATKLARYYQSLMDSGKFESRAALARYLGVSRARVTQVLNRPHHASG
jgi:hypothetical protein